VILSVEATGFSLVIGGLIGFLLYAKERERRRLMNVEILPEENFVEEVSRCNYEV
jgi:hypothetical protein